jgi:hypothetical protein
VTAARRRALLELSAQLALDGRLRSLGYSVPLRRPRRPASAILIRDCGTILTQEEYRRATGR